MYIGLCEWPLIQRKLNEQGPYVLSRSIRPFLDMLLDIITVQFGGDVHQMGFDDGLYCSWIADEEFQVNLGDCCAAAAACALALQKQAVDVILPNTVGMRQAIRIAITCGDMTSLLLDVQSGVATPPQESSSSSRWTEPALAVMTGPCIREMSYVARASNAKEIIVSPTFVKCLEEKTSSLSSATTSNSNPASNAPSNVIVENVVDMDSPDPLKPQMLHCFRLKTIVSMPKLRVKSFTAFADRAAPH